MNGIRLKTELLVIMLFLSVFPIIDPITVSGKEVIFGCGSGTVDDPYCIKDVYDLQAMKFDLNANYIINNDINASETRIWNSGKGFIPVGTNIHRFTGILDGQNFTIEGLFIDLSDQDYIALFGYIGKGSGVKNVCIMNYQNIGNNHVGGLVGYNHLGNVTNCYAKGNVMGDFEVGGMIGHNSGNVNNCYSSGTVRGNNRIGLLVGDNSGLVKNCIAKGDVNGISSIGIIAGSNNGTILNCNAMGNISGTDDFGGIVGLNWGIVSNSHYNIEDVCINGDKHITIGALYNEQYKNWKLNNYNLSIMDYSKTLVRHGKYYIINNVQGMKDLLGFADVVDYSFQLTSDIDLFSAQGLYIPYFASKEFDGNNNTISNLNINNSNSNVGLFGINKAGRIQNIKILDVDVTGKYWVGGLVGLNMGGIVFNCEAMINVSGNRFVGGLVGKNTGLIEQSRTKGNVRGTEVVGGLIGSNTGNIYNCNSKVTTTSYSGPNGGLVGSNIEGFITNSYAIGNVNGGYCIGGLVGYNWWGKITKSFSNGNIKGGDVVGGLVGKACFASVSYCYTKGTVNGYSDVGGLIGHIKGGMVSNSYAIGEVSGYRFVGGLVGNNDCGSIYICYSVGNLICSEWGVGGLIGSKKYGNVSQSFWDISTSGQGSSSGGEGKTTTEMKTRTIYTDAGWDFVNVWSILEHTSYPVLRWQDGGYPVAKTGPDMLVHEGTVVILDGSDSIEDNGILNYTWRFIDKQPVTLYGVITSYRFNTPGIFVIYLQVKNMLGNIDEDSIKVIISDRTPPIANAGLDMIIDEGSIVILNGNDSSDNVGIVKYTWTFIDGIPITLYGSQAYYQFNNPGIFHINLNVTDASGHWHLDSTIVTVNDVTTPIANAGLDIIIDEGTIVTFDGNGSSDNVGIVNWTWTLFDEEIINLTGIDPDYQFNTPGVYIVTLNVTDASGHWSTDSMTVMVIDITAPVAVSGSNLTVDEGTVVIFDGKRSHDNVGIVNYTWTFLDGDPIVLYGVDPSYRFDTPGVYIVTLNVSDAAGLWAIDSLTVTIRDITPPVADAGGDQAIEEEDTVQFDGSGSNDNVGIVNYSWSFYDGSSKVILYGISPSHTFSISGTYTVTLTVKDEAGNEGSDTMGVEVREKEGYGNGDGSDDLWLFIWGSIVVVVAILFIGWFLLFRRKKNGEEE